MPTSLTAGGATLPSSGRKSDPRVCDETAGRRIFQSMSRLLWIAQWILALIFLVAGVAKLVMPLQTVADQIGLPVGLLHFVALMEVLGALGMILPGLLHVRPGLTPLAAAGLIVIMIGAVT